MKRRVAQFLSSSRLPGLQGQAAQAGGLVGHLRRNGYRGYFAAAAQGAERPARIPWANTAGRPMIIRRKALVVQRIVEDMSARLEVLLDLGSGLSLSGAQHAYAVAGRTAAAAPGDPGPIQPVRGRVRPGRAVGGPASSGYRGAAARAGSAQGIRQFAVRGRARTGCRCGKRTGSSTSVRPPASTAGEILYSGPPPGLADVKKSRTRPYLFGETEQRVRSTRPPKGWLKLRGVTRNNLDRLDADIPLGVFTCVTGISGSGKSSPDQPVPGGRRRRQTGSAQGGRRR